MEGKEQSYGENDAFVIEPRGIEHIPEDQRYGKVRKLFNVWFASNLHLSVWTIGALGITLGLNFIGALTSILTGTFLGAVVVGLSVAMGPKLGMPQMPQSRASFGYHGNFVPAILSWLNFLGWFTVNNILGGLAMKEALHVPYLVSMLIISLVTIVLALYGHNLIHGFERIMTWVVGLIFLVMTFVMLAHHGQTGAIPHHNSPVVWLTEFTVMFSYAVGWSPYGADYGRYLPQTTRIRGPVWITTFGLFISIAWVSVVGAALAAGFNGAAPITLIGKTMGWFSVVAYVGLALGSMSSNVLNIYSGSLAALTFGLPLKRWTSAILIGGVSIVLSLIFSSEGKAVDFLQNFLLFLVYWVTPWFGVQAVEFYINKRTRIDNVLDFYRPRGPMAGIRWKGLGSFIIGFVVSIPFMASAIYTGPIGHALKGADISYFVSGIVAGGLYYLFTISERRSRRASLHLARPTVDQ
ncbi:purine-cytosine permease family protein [Alicyclobacillus fastidiosus]|uniref:Cytosine permease n=1 Tax=Alicyclobacillus fastidiosus TaxID=392011 RepID=A0ABV5ACC3_9BACL|nr:cytosine permease [Alicyclobacillus fastidiosus]WEH07579.1 cytosine permease [Alicyclobacillus fastidiosus]